MKPLPRFLFIALAAATLAQAQGNRPVGNPDTDWANLTALAGNARTPPGRTETKPRAEFAAAWAASANQSKQTAQAARNFINANPADPRAPQARKLEVTSLLKGVLPTDDDHGAAAFQLASAYRADPANSVKDRFEVAALMESQRYQIQTNGYRLADNPVASETFADALHAEFGDTPEVHAYYLGVVNHADCETGFRVAGKIAGLPVADDVRRQAQTELDRHDLIGKPFAVTLKATDGKRIDLKAQGAVTVLYVWSEHLGVNQWGKLARAKAAVPPGTQWVYLALDTTPPEMDAAMANAPFPGVQSAEPGGPKSASLKALKVRRVPFVYVINAAGSLVGYGPPEWLPRLLHDANP